MAERLRVNHRGHMRAQARVGGNYRQRLRWALHFAAQEVSALSARRRDALKAELLAFTGPIAFERGELVALPSGEDLAAAHARAQAIIRSLVTTGSAVIARGIVVVGRDARSAWTTVDHPDGDIATAVAIALGHLLTREGHRVKECPAPRRVTADPEPCRRWFLGRPNQRCCSEGCSNRASTWAARFGRAVERYHDTRIEVHSYQLPRHPGRWRPVAWIEGPTGSTLFRSAPGVNYGTRTRADQEARRVARRLVDARRQHR